MRVKRDYVKSRGKRQFVTTGGFAGKRLLKRKILAVPKGFEPLTFGLGNRCSILLSYGTVRFTSTTAQPFEKFNGGAAGCSPGRRSCLNRFDWRMI